MVEKRWRWLMTSKQIELSASDHPKLFCREIFSGGSRLNFVIEIYGLRLFLNIKVRGNNEYGKSS